MKVHKYGVVILQDGPKPVRIEDWVIEREPSDPIGPTEEQLLLAFAIHWARERFEKAVQTETTRAFLDHMKAEKAKFDAAKAEEALN
jgi:hypothetical protein